jgi:hypothetical protein
MPMLNPGLPLEVLLTLWSRAPSSTRATSRRRTMEPSGRARTMIWRNSSGEDRRPCVVMFMLRSTRPGIGSSPTRPVANCAFCSRMAAATSPGVRPSWASRSGCSQTRIEYSLVPKASTEATPGMRRNSSTTLMRP